MPPSDDRRPEALCGDDRSSRSSRNRCSKLAGEGPQSLPTFTTRRRGCSPGGAIAHISLDWRRLLACSPVLRRARDLGAPSSFTNRALGRPRCPPSALRRARQLRRLFDDPDFAVVLKNSVIFVIGSAIIGQFVLGLALALLLDYAEHRGYRTTPRLRRGPARLGESDDHRRLSLGRDVRLLLRLAQQGARVWSGFGPVSWLGNGADALVDHRQYLARNRLRDDHLPRAHCRRSPRRSTRRRGSTAPAPGGASGITRCRISARSPR